MSKKLKILYATMNSFAQLAVAFIFVCLAYYLDLYGALWQSVYVIWLAYALMVIAVVVSLASVVAGWKRVMQHTEPTRLWKVLLWLPWVIISVCIVALLALLLLLSI